jgi:hypothetical protein
MTLKGKNNHYDIKVLSGYGCGISVSEQKLVLKDVVVLLSEANKLDKNQQQQKFLKELRSINRKLLKQEKTARKHLILGIIISSVASGIIGYTLSLLL